MAQVGLDGAGNPAVPCIRDVQGSEGLLESESANLGSSQWEPRPRGATANHVLLAITSSTYKVQPLR